MEICDFCKVKLVEFYHFKLRSEEVRKIQSELNSGSEDKLRELDLQIDDKTVYNTIQIVRNYIEKHSISEILEDENERRLIIIPKLGESTETIQVGFVKNEAVDEPVLEESLKQEAIEPEYLDEDCLEEYNDSKEIIQEDDVETMEVEEEFMDDDILVEYEEDSEASVDYQQSASESVSDSRKSSNTRRTSHPEKWACNKRKTLRNSGQTYLNSKGKLVDAKQMRESCGTTCRNKCITKITEEDRQRAFDTYWGFGDIVKQRKFIYKHITSTIPKRRRTPSSSRTLTLQFYLEARNDDETSQMVQVCKKMFKNTLVISSQVIQGIVKKYSIEGFNDTRGKFERKLSEAQLFAIEHVKKFPFFYIEQTMTKVQCYQMYRDECAELGLEPVKEGNYRDIFDKQNQGSFLKTEKISCELCHRFYKADEDERAELQKEHDDHISLGTNKKCRDRALGRIRHKRAQERKKAQRAAVQHQF
jgi:hypothetical protein